MMRPYQREAHTAIVAGLKIGGRGQLHAACGSGKTFMAQRVAEELVPGSGLIVVLAPSLALVGQILREWQAGSMVAFGALAVCSDENVADAPVRTEDLSVPVTTDPDAITSWLGHGGRQVIIGTYTSADRIGEALRRAGSEADLLLCDEGHHLFGKRDAARRRIITDSEFLPHQRRLVMTATPDVAGWQSADALSWRDEELFGPVLYQYAFPRGIAEGYLKNYRVLVLGIGDAEARALLADTASEHIDGEIALRTVVAQAALAHARLTYDTKRAITFHPRVQMAADFARTLPATIARMPAAKQPAGPVHATHISGAMDGHERHAILSRLAVPPPGGWTVVSNAQCLTEGVDIPAVDTIVFTHPSRSVTKVTQAVGRALRRSKDTADTATIIVPITVPDTDTEIDDLDAGDFRVLFEVVRALRAHDEGFAAELDEERWTQSLDTAGERGEGFADELDQHRRTWSLDNPGEREARTPSLPGRVTFQLPNGTSTRILDQLRLLTVRNSTSPWWEGYADAVAFYREHGHLNVPEGHIAASGRRLDSWVSQCRRHRRKRWLPQERIDAVDRIGMIWDPLDAQRRRLLSDARAYYKANGDINIPSGYVTPEGRLLGSQFKALRAAYREGRIHDPLLGALNDMGMRWDPQAARRQDLLDACDRYRKRFGNLDVPAKFVDDQGYRLGPNLSNVRSVAEGATTYRDGRPRTVDADFRAELERRGVDLTLRVTALNDDQKRAMVGKVQAGALLKDAREALDIGLSTLAVARRDDEVFNSRLKEAIRDKSRPLSQSQKEAVIKKVAAGNSLRHTLKLLDIRITTMVIARRDDEAFNSRLKASAQKQPLSKSQKKAIIQEIAAGKSLRQALRLLAIGRSPVDVARRNDHDFDSELVNSSNGRIRPAKRTTPEDVHSG